MKSNKEILKTAIEKAIDNGWAKHRQLGTVEVYDQDGSPLKMFIAIGLNTYSILELIYSHDFAKALWGDEYNVTTGSDKDWGYRWHLQQMVLEEDPIKYLGENI